ncbi:MAG: Crp/Fnr family transcriptional regulator [bacterium]
MHQILHSSQLFGQLDPDSLKEVAAAATLRKFGDDEMIFHEGDLAGGLYIVGSGKVKVFKLSPEGKEQILMIAEAGDTFAEAALFSGRNYPASAQTLEGGEIVVISRERFYGVLKRNPDLALNLIGRLSELLRKLTRLVEGLALTDVTTRLAQALVEKLDSTPNRGETLTLSEKKSVLASQIGTIPETLSRSLARLSREGIIKVDRSQITIVDPERLRRAAQNG